MKIFIDKPIPERADKYEINNHNVGRFQLEEYNDLGFILLLKLLGFYF